MVFPIPGGELAFAGGGQGAVQGGEKQVLAHRRSLLSFGGLGVDAAQQVELPSQVPEGRSGTEIPPFSAQGPSRSLRSEEHTSELQSRLHLVCRLLLEKKKENHYLISSYHLDITLL